MPETNMSISVNGQSQVPPGFRFHPTEEELLRYYLRKKVSYEKIDLDVIREVDLNKLEPWDIQEMCKIGTTPQNDWYLFSHKDKKYPTGTRTNRATAAGFWKATGRDKVIHSNGKRIGMRKTLVFYLGRAPHGHKSDWIMHEYRLDENIIFKSHISSINNNAMGEGAEEGWVVCRIFKKKSHYKGPMMTSSCLLLSDEIKVDNKGAVEQILHYMVDTTCKDENDSNALDNSSYQERLPSPDSAGHHQMIVADEGSSMTDWAALDRLVASQLDGQTEIITTTSSYCNQPDQYDLNQLLMRPISSSRSEIDLWTFTGSSSPSSYATCQTHMHNAFPI